MSYKHFIGVTIIYLVTAALMFACGVFSLGTFPVLGLGATLATAFVITALVWVFYSLLGLAICIPLRVKSPGFLLATVLGTVCGAAAVAVTSSAHPNLGISHGWLEAIPFAFADTIAIWIAAYVSGYLRPQTFWPVRR